MIKCDECPIEAALHVAITYNRISTGMIKISLSITGVVILPHVTGAPAMATFNNDTLLHYPAHCSLLTLKMSGLCGRHIMDM